MSQQIDLLRLPLSALLASMSAPATSQSTCGTIVRCSCAFFFTVASALAFTAGQCSAAWTFFGPTPYRSVADSPFPIDGSSPSFFLEDFEDGVLNTPGIIQRNTFPIPGNAGLAFVRSPGPDTDSVDRDDGVVDGLGRNGHSLVSGVHTTIPTNPLLHQFLFEFEFNENELGFLPDSFGFVWTDGPPLSSLGLRIVTQEGNEIVSEGITGLGDSDRDGSTLEDVFLGVIDTERIRTATVIGGFRGDLTGPPEIEIDHVQYGLAVPEPSTIALAMSFLAFLLGWRLRHHLGF